MRFEDLPDECQECNHLNYHNGIDETDGFICRKVKAFLRRKKTPCKHMRSSYDEKDFN